MPNFQEYFANPAKQKRSHDRIEKILDATEYLAQENTNEIVEARSIIGRVHISIGAIYHHFPSIGNIFASLMVRRISQNQSRVIKMIDLMGNDTTIQEFSDQMIQLAFQDWVRGNMRVRNAAIRFFYRNAKRPESLFAYGDVLIPHLKLFIDRNTSNQFRVISDQEWPLIIRVIQTAITTPFIEMLDIAGSNAHLEFATQNMVRLLSAPHNQTT